MQNTDQKPVMDQGNWCELSMYISFVVTDYKGCLLLHMRINKGKHVLAIRILDTRE